MLHVNDLQVAEIRSDCPGLVRPDDIEAWRMLLISLERKYRVGDRERHFERADGVHPCATVVDFSRLATNWTVDTALSMTKNQSSTENWAAMSRKEELESEIHSSVRTQEEAGR